MFSIITVSKDQDKVDNLRKNLELVFGRSSPWELLAADGSVEDIFTGFNQQAGLANGDYLIFTHDDVKFLCNREAFGTPVELMDKVFTGFVGAAGATTMEAEGCWWKTDNRNCRGAVYHPSKDGSPFGIHLNCWPHVAAQFGQTVVCDGVLLMCSRRTFKKLGGFDTETFKGFHFYDIEVTTRAHLHGLQNYVAPIPLLHNSYGQVNENWEENRKIYIEKYKKNLPLNL